MCLCVCVDCYNEVQVRASIGFKSRLLGLQFNLQSMQNNASFLSYGVLLTLKAICRLFRLLCGKNFLAILLSS